MPLPVPQRILLSVGLCCFTIWGNQRASRRQKGWGNSKKQPVANKELWLALDEERHKFADISFHKVKGHADNAGNIRADELANRAMDELEAG